MIEDREHRRKGERAEENGTKGLHHCPSLKYELRISLLMDE